MDDYSIPLRECLSKLLLGLGLPLPALHRKELWGYDRDYDRHIYLPNDRCLAALFTAFDMNNSGDYHTDDILEWLIKASGITMSRRTFFLLKKERPLYPEYKLSLEERINIFNGLASPPTSKETLKKKNFRQAYYEQRKKSLAQGNGETEGAEEAGNPSEN